MSSYGRTAVLLTSVNGLVLGPAIALAGLLTIIASLARIDLSVNCLSSFETCLGCEATVFADVVERDLCFSWALLEALFQVVPLRVFSACHSANDSMTCFTSSTVSPACSASHRG